MEGMDTKVLDHTFAHKLPGGNKYQNLVLSRGMVINPEDLLSALQNDLSKPLMVRDAIVELLDEAGAVAMKWEFKGAYVVKATYSAAPMPGEEHVFESVELAF